MGVRRGAAVSGERSGWRKKLLMDRDFNVTASWGSLLRPGIQNKSTAHIKRLEKWRIEGLSLLGDVFTPKVWPRFNKSCLMGFICVRSLSVTHSSSRAFSTASSVLAAYRLSSDQSIKPRVHCLYGSVMKRTARLSRPGNCNFSSNPYPHRPLRPPWGESCGGLIDRNMVWCVCFWDLLIIHPPLLG